MQNSHLTNFEAAFKNLNVRYQGPGNPTPHKACMLLAVIDQMDIDDEVVENRFKYEPQILDNYDRYFKVTRPQATRSEAHYPFVFLVSDEFWHLHDNQNQKLNLSAGEAQSLAGKSLQKIFDVVDFASLDADLFELLKDPEARWQLRQTLIRKWLPDYEHKIIDEIRKSKEMHRLFEVDLTEDETVIAIENWRKVQNFRDRKFRFRVLDAYGFRCAATGWHLRTPPKEQSQNAEHTQSTLLEAAHIMPVSDSRNNRISNGMALTPTLHVALDRRLIAPGTDHLWHVSEFIWQQAEVDEGARQISTIDGQRIFLPRDQNFHPTRSVLEWSEKHLL